MAPPPRRKGRGPSQALPSAWAQAQLSTDPLAVCKAGQEKQQPERKFSTPSLSSLCCPLPLSTPEDLQGWSEADPPGSFHSLSRPPKPSPSTKWGERLLPSRTKMLQVAKLDSSLISALTGCVTQDRSFFKHLKSRFAYQ